jgi:type I restriction enzyme S subunit
MKWNEFKIGDIAPFKYGKTLKEADRQQGKYKVYSSSGLCGWSNNRLANRGIIIGRKGTAGSVYFSETPFFAIDTSFYISEVSSN